MNFGYPLSSLQQLAVTKAAIYAWSQPNVHHVILGFGREQPQNSEVSDEKKNWSRLESVVENEVMKFRLPPILKNEVLNLVKPIGEEILSYRKFWLVELQFDEEFWMEILPKLCWTSLGTIDHAKISEMVARDETYDPMKRYRMACSSCLEEDINILYRRLRRFNVEISRGQSILENMWTDACENDGVCIDFCLQGLKYAAEHGYLAAAKYFWMKLPSNPRKRCVKEICMELTKIDTLQSYRQDVYYYLFANFTAREWVEFEDDPFVIKHLFKWPYIDMLMKAIMDAVDHPLINYASMCTIITELVIDRICTEKHWIDFWSVGSAYNKNFVREMWGDDCDCNHLLRMNSYNIVQLYLRDTDLELRKKLILTLFDDELEDRNINNINVGLCEIGKVNIDLIEYLIAECLKTREDLIEFVEDLRIGGLTEEWDDHLRYINLCISRQLEKNKRKRSSSNSSLSSS